MLIFLRDEILFFWMFWTRKFENMAKISGMIKLLRIEIMIDNRGIRIRISKKI